MKIVIKTEALTKILTPLSPIINDNHVVPILQNVKLEFTKKTLYATGNNLEVVCTNSTPLASEKENSFCVNFLMLLAIVKSIPDKEIVLEVNKKIIEITHKKGSFDLPIESSKEFTVPEKENFKKKANVKGKALRSALKVANRFILNDDMDAMANISMSIGKKVFIRSTDRYRLFEEKIKGSGDTGDILISGKASMAVSALIEEIEDDVTMVYNDNSIFLKFDNKEVMVVQQQGKFPIAMFSKVIETIDKAEQLKLNIKDFLTALKRVSIMSTKDKHTSVNLNIAKKKVLISTESIATNSKGLEEVESSFKSKRECAFPLKSFIEILSVFEKEPEIYLDERNFLFIKQNKKKGAIAPIAPQKINE